MSIPPRPRTTIQKQKNANGQGSIWFSEKRNRCVAQFVGSSLTSSGLPKRHTKVFRFKKDAQDWISEQKRLKLHGKTSYSADSKINMDGLLAKEIESSILAMLKAKGADLSNAEIAGKFDGYSEAWSKSTFEAKSIKELMRLTEEFEEN
jgi:hypothetical protein